MKGTKPTTPKKMIAHATIVSQIKITQETEKEKKKREKR